MKRSPLKRKTRLKPRSDKRAAYMRSAERQLRSNAQGKPCSLRLDGCRGDPDYTVLAHIRKFGWGGMGQKPHDILAIFACDCCHEKQERRHPDCTDGDILRALGETLMIQLQSGIIRIEGDGMD